MTRIDLQPSTSSLPAKRGRLFLRPRKPLSRRELHSVYQRVESRILAGREPFGIFVIKHGRGRVIRLISVRDSSYPVQMRKDQALKHWIGTYDATADLGDVWDDLCSFDRAVA